MLRTINISIPNPIFYICKIIDDNFCDICSTWLFRRNIFKDDKYDGLQYCSKNCHDKSKLLASKLIDSLTDVVIDDDVSENNGIYVDIL